MKKIEPLSKEEINEIINFYLNFKEKEIFEKLMLTKQHRTSNTFRHVCLVTEECIYYGIKNNIRYDYKSLIRGAMLHDFYFYDWRKDKINKKGHLRKHPSRAMENALKVFNLNKIEKDIIYNHMWPITLFHIPKSKEAKLVSRMDKKVTLKEFLAKRKKTVLFDLDGTLLDTLEDLQIATNYALKKYNYPERTLDEIRSFIGNGVAKLIERSLPDGINNKDYPSVLKDFKDYYSSHYSFKTKPYPNMKKVLKTLKEKGYSLGVITNKVDHIAKDLINTYYPNLFNVVQGDLDNLKKKPNPEMGNKVLKQLKIKNKRKVIYVGDTNVDYEFAKNLKVNVILVSYGYRNKIDLLKLKNEPIIIDSPFQLLNILL